MNAYTIAMCATLMAMGALGDRCGRKRVFGLGIVFFGLSSLVCGLADNASLLIGGRIIQGISAAAMLASQVAVLSHQFRDSADRGRAFGVWGIVFGLGLGLGPIIGGAIVTFASWEWVFLFHVGVALITMTFLSAGVEESSDPDATRMDIAGMVTLTLAVFSLVYLITQGQELGWTSATGLSVLAFSAFCFAVFTIVEHTVSRPMFDFGAFLVRPFSGALLGSSGMNFSYWPFIIYLPIYLHAVLGYDAVNAGLMVLAYTLPTFIVPPQAEKLLLRTGPDFVIPLGLFTIGLGFFSLHLVVTSESANWMTLLPGCVLAGIGLGLTNTPVTNTATAALPPARAGMASGMDMSARMISLSVNIALMGFILLTAVSGYLAHALPEFSSALSLDDLAAAISAGNTEAAGTSEQTVAITHEALKHGIGAVTLYGALCACAFALMSRVVFGKKASAFAQP